METKIKNFILDLLFPKNCFECGLDGFFFCPECAKKLKSVMPVCFVCGSLVPFNADFPGRTCSSCRRKTEIYAFISPFLFSESLVRKGIHEIKYKKIKLLGDDLALFLEDYLDKLNLSLENYLAIPIPLHWRKKTERGFNQAEVFCRAVSKSLKIPMNANLLKRVRFTDSQTAFSKEERIINMKNVFSVADFRPLLGKNIILVDDVKTTGTTLEEAAAILKKSGAKRMIAVTFAH